jgi:hypothetical protein
MKSVEALFQAAMEAHEVKMTSWPEPVDPCEDWRCGTCAYWRKTKAWPAFDVGWCHSSEANGRRLYQIGKRVGFSCLTSRDYGCRWFEAKPLEDNGADIPIASHNAS